MMEKIPLCQKRPILEKHGMWLIYYMHRNILEIEQYVYTIAIMKKRLKGKSA